MSDKPNYPWDNPGITVDPTMAALWEKTRLEHLEREAAKARAEEEEKRQKRLKQTEAARAARATLRAEQAPEKQQQAVEREAARKAWSDAVAARDKLTQEWTDRLNELHRERRQQLKDAEDAVIAARNHFKTFN